MSTPTVLAISRQFGSGGAYIGREVALRLGFHYADREILAEAAHALDVETSDVAPLEERVHGFWERFGTMFSSGAIDTPFMPPPLPVVSPHELFELERQVIRTLAERGRAVIVGRGAAHILHGRPDVIRVFLHAPLDARVDLAMREYDIADRNEALAIVRDTDVNRARFVRRISGREWHDATFYDATFDTAAVGLSRVADLIVDMLRQPASDATASPTLAADGSVPA